MDDERPTKTGRISALESAFRGFAERDSDAVVNPKVGTVFDCVGEAYDYYNLFSWECGFGIRYGKSRTNVRGTKCMQELLCSCSVRMQIHLFIHEMQFDTDEIRFDTGVPILLSLQGKPKQTNSTSSRCQCPVMIRLLRTDDQGWYICESRIVHNHKMLNTCAEKLHFPSHRHIDKYTRELVSQLRENNINLAKVYNIIGTFFGRIENVPFTKRCL
jgi:hypothetical protein